MLNDDADAEPFEQTEIRAMHIFPSSFLIKVNPPLHTGMPSRTYLKLLAPVRVRNVEMTLSRHRGFWPERLKFDQPRSLTLEKQGMKRTTRGGGRNVHGDEVALLSRGRHTVRHHFAF
jgi:hypothetical protein